MNNSENYLKISTLKPVQMPTRNLINVKKYEKILKKEELNFLIGINNIIQTVQALRLSAKTRKEFEELKRKLAELEHSFEKIEENIQLLETVVGSLKEGMTALGLGKVEAGFYLQGLKNDVINAAQVQRAMTDSIYSLKFTTPMTIPTHLQSKKEDLLGRVLGIKEEIEGVLEMAKEDLKKLEAR